MKLKCLLILPLLVASLQAASVSDLTFTLNDDSNGYTVSYCDQSASGSLDIPSAWNGLPVTLIGERAFFRCSSLTSITIGNSVTSIDIYAFQECSSLTSITIGNSVTSIGHYAFVSCWSLASATFEGDAPTFGYNVFYGSGSVTIFYYSNKSGWSNTIAGRLAEAVPAPVTEVLHNVGGSTTFSIPSDWTISSNAPNFFCHTSSYSVNLNVLSFPATDSQKKIYVSDYDALNTALAPSLYTLEFDYIHQQVNVGGGKLHDMGTPTLNYGPTSNYNFYLGSSSNSYTISVQQYPSILQNILTFNYIFFDGSTIYIARATVNENIATTAEKILLTDVISSVSSTAIQSPLEDSDGDGISNYDEVIFYSSDPTLKDTNSDGIDDDVITSLGGNPRWDISSTLEYIEENPQTFNLYSSDNITDLRAGSTIIQVTNNEASVQIQMEESSDLESWTETGAAATMIVPADTDTKFYRFKMAE